MPTRRLPHRKSIGARWQELRYRRCVRFSRTRLGGLYSTTLRREEPRFSSGLKLVNVVNNKATDIMSVAWYRSAPTLAVKEPHDDTLHSWASVVYPLKANGITAKV